ncbi:MAG: VPLPA-CTERM sorting domain-containing protein [Planctomycetota bacterium]
MNAKVIALSACALGAGWAGAADVDIDFVDEVEENSFTQKWIQRSASSVEGIRISLAGFDTSVSDDFEILSLKFPRHNGVDSGFAKWGAETVEGAVFTANTSLMDSDFRFDVKFDGSKLTGGDINKSSQIAFAWDIEYLINGEYSHGFRWSNDSSYVGGLDLASSNKSNGGYWYRLAQSTAAVPVPHPGLMAGAAIGAFAVTRRRR